MPEEKISDNERDLWQQKKEIGRLTEERDREAYKLDHYKILSLALKMIALQSSKCENTLTTMSNFFEMMYVYRIDVEVPSTIGVCLKRKYTTMKGIRGSKRKR